MSATDDKQIVGGGTAGLTLADRLAGAGLSVAVVEGGGFYELDNSNISQIPAYDTQFSNALPSSIQPLVDWGIVSPPQPQLQDRQIHYTQGKTLGGGSARNYLAYHRGTTGSYNLWASIVGDASYQFSNFLQYFKKSVHFTPPDYQKLGRIAPYTYDPFAFEPCDGPLQVSYAPYYHPFSPGISRAFQTLGLPEIDGLNSGNLLGYAAATTTQDPEEQIRSSSETSFGQRTIYATYTQFYKQTVAQKVTFDNTSTATGVLVNTAGVVYHLAATKEVIVSSGAFRSPQLLMLSGIGPQSTLASFGIPVIKDLPGVGQGMQDQNYFGAVYKVNVETFSHILSDPSAAAEATQQYQTQQTGPLTNSGANYIGWEKVPASLAANFSDSTRAMLNTFPADWPDFELLPLPVQIVPTTDDSNYMSVTMAVLSTNSRGNVTLNSTSALDNPIITLPWLQSAEDQQVAVAALRRARQIAAASGLVVGSEVAPGPSVQTDAEILSYIQESIGPIHHASCTNRMGSSNDPMAVVDSEAKVYGVQGLRVVDISAFPVLPPGHPQSTVYALAEKIAANIIGQ